MRTSLTVRTSDDSRLHVETDGIGEPLFLIPGLGGAAAFWKPVSSFLRGRFRLISMDHRGTNRSTTHDENYAIADLAKDVVDILDGLNLARAHILGHSTGGLVAQTLALDHPERVSRLILSGTWGRPDYHFRQLFGVRVALIRLGRPDLYQRLAHILGYPAMWLNQHESELEKSINSADLANGSATEARIRMLLQFDRLAELNVIKAPTLIMSAKDDFVVPFHHAVMLKEAIPSARLIEMQGGHFFPNVSSDQYARTVTDFLTVN